MDSDDEIPQLVEVAPAMPPVGIKSDIEDIPVRHPVRDPEMQLLTKF